MSRSLGPAAGLAIAAIIAIALGRLWLAIDVPLTDTTEARYGEQARKMVETGDWLVPQEDYGVPFLGKPPLAIWLSAAGIEVLGAGQLGPRILILLSAFGFLLYLYRWLATEVGPNAAWAGVLVISSSILFFISMAAVMTDLILIVCVDVALLAFWSRMRGAGRGTEWVFFIMIGLGLLTKGPLAGVLIVAPIAGWALLGRRVTEVWQRIAWVQGAAIAALVALPWYIAAEIRNPGFLFYFIVGENLERFLVADWKGDLYGDAHQYPIGTIWLFLFVSVLPWSVLGIAPLVHALATRRGQWRERRDLLAFALLAAFVPLVLFTFSRNIIITYALPAIVPVVVAALAVIGESGIGRRFVAVTAIIAIAVTGFWLTGEIVFRDRIEQESERPMIAAVGPGSSLPPGPVYYWQDRYFSADYYSRGHARVLTDEGELETAIALPPAYVVMDASRFDALPERIRSSLEYLGTHSKKSLYGTRD